MFRDFYSSLIEILQLFSIHLYDLFRNFEGSKVTIKT